MFNRIAFFASLFPVTILVCSNTFSSSIVKLMGIPLKARAEVLY